MRCKKHGLGSWQGLPDKTAQNGANDLGSKYDEWAKCLIHGSVTEISALDTEEIDLSP